MLLDPVLWLVFSLQAAILIRCLVLARRDDSEALDDLWKQFKRDIIGRARRGDGADWVRYMDEADRVHERRVDRLGVLATVALVVGIGGTMAALAFRLVGLDIEAPAGADQPPTDELRALVTAVGPALLASLGGVLNNLLITVFLFRLSDSRFEEALGGFRKALQECSDVNPPQEKFADAVKDQLGQAFRNAVRTFPEAFARLDESVQHLSEVTKEQSRSMLLAAAGLREGADGLTGAASEIAPAADLLSTSTAELRAVPDQLRRTLDETRTAWAQEMRFDQDAFIGGVLQVMGSQYTLLDRTRNAFDEWEHARRDAAAQQQTQWRESVDLVQKAASEFIRTAEDLPTAFAREVRPDRRHVGEQFGLEAQQHAADLRKAIGDGNQALGAQIQTSTRELQDRFLNDTARVVGESAEEVHRRVGEPLLSSLQAVSRGIEEALTTLPENARSFSASLSSADKKLGQSIDQLPAGGDTQRGVPDHIDQRAAERHHARLRAAPGRTERTDRRAASVARPDGRARGRAARVGR